MATFGVDYRWGAGDADNARTLATQLIELQPDAIFCQTTQSVAALRRATRNTVVWLSSPFPSSSGSGLPEAATPICSRLDSILTRSTVR